MISSSELELTKRGRVERVGSKAMNVTDGIDFLQAPFRAFELCDGDRAAQGNDRRRMNDHEHVIERYDPLPIRVFASNGTGVHRSNGRLDVILGQLRAAGRRVEKCLSFR